MPVYGPALTKHLPRASVECLYGIYTSTIIKALWTADSESSAFLTYARYINHMMFESLHYLGGTGWPLFSMWPHKRRLCR